MRTKSRKLMLPGAAVAAVAVLALGGCQDSAGPTVSSALLQNAAQVAADATMEDVTLATTPFGFGQAGVSAQTAAGAGQRWGPLGGAMGIGGTFSGTRSVTFYDANGAVQTSYDSLTTDSIQFVLEVSGSASRDNWSASIDRTRQMTISGLLGQETTRTFNGTGTETVSRSRTDTTGTTSTYDMNGSFTVDNVVVPVPGSTPRWPLSGTITHDLTVTVVNGPNGDQTKTVTVVVTFDGTSTATAVINGQTMQIDLTTPPGRNCIKGGRFGRSG
jgi:hypothetical protein